MSRNMLLERLTDQILNDRKITYSEAARLAKGLLIKRGHLNKDGSYTYEGNIRSLMTPGERAIDRAVKRYGGKASNYKYNETKNYAYKR